MSYTAIKAKADKEWNWLKKLPQPLIQIGMGTCGRASGAEEILQVARKSLKELNLLVRIMEVGCIGMCYLEPMMAVRKPGGPTILYGNLTADKTEMILQRYLIEDDPCAKWAVCTLGDARIEDIRLYEDHPMMGPQVRIVLRNCGLIDPNNIHHYIAKGGYSGLQRALGMSSAEVIEEVKASGLRGRGGAGFSTGIKWEFARNALERTKYIICNADEGDPGAFMDRALLEGDPHAVLEGMLICAFAIGAVEAYIYVRAEYPLAIERLLKAMADMEQIGLLGNRILDSHFALDIHIKEGAGAFVVRGRRFPLNPVFGISPPTSTMSKRLPMYLPFSKRARIGMPVSAPKRARGPKPFHLPGMWRAPD
jgi:NADH-quinone oxidoreductase subunit F